MARTAPAQPLPITGQAVPELAAYDTVITTLMQKYQVPGVALAVARNGKLVFARGYGYADTALQLPVQPDSLFRLGSIAKPHTAAAILRLIEQGRLSLSNKAFSILSNLKPLPGTMVDPLIATITIQELLNHTSGWFGEADGSGYDPMFDVHKIALVMGMPPPADCPTIIRYQLGRRLDKPPGTYFSYLNFGYCILGEVIHQVSGVPYDIYVEANVTGPIGNSRTALGGTLKTDRLPGEVIYYDFPGDPLVSSVFPPFGAVPWPYGGYYLLANQADGALISSTIELLRFGISINGDGPTRLFQTPPSPDPSNGMVPPVGQGGVWVFNGGAPGTSTGLLLDAPSGSQDRTVLAFLANTRPPSDAWYVDMNGQLLQAGHQIAAWPSNDLFPQFQTSFAVVHAASFVAKSLAPDEFATIQGVNLAGSTATAADTTWPITLAESTVTIVDSSGATLLAPLDFISPQKINFLVPAEAQPGPATVTVSGTVGGALSANVWIDPVSPGLFTANSSGTGVPAALATRYTASGAEIQEPVFQCGSVGCTTVPLDLGAAGDQVILQLSVPGCATQAAHRM
jgi:N-acyl-D-amino-acid deacylase